MSSVNSVPITMHNETSTDKTDTANSLMDIFPLRLEIHVANDAINNEFQCHGRYKGRSVS